MAGVSLQKELARSSLDKKNDKHGYKIFFRICVLKQGGGFLIYACKYVLLCGS